MAWNQSANDDDLEKLFLSDAPEAASRGSAHGPAAVGSGLPWDANNASFGTTNDDRVPSALPDGPPSTAHAEQIPVRQARAAAAPRAGVTGATGLSLRYEVSTVDESDIASVMREARAIWGNLALVCNPFFGSGASMLQHWDLWGPLIFTLALAALLSLQSDDKEAVFSIVFVVVIAGALLLTANVVLLGGAVSFFQSISLLGYCMFPVDAAAIVCSLVSNAIVRVLAIVLGIAWAMRASVPFVAGAVGEGRRFLAVFPLTLMYAILGWLTFIS